jgi:tetratricopeptide (TPR) repeat protein
MPSRRVRFAWGFAVAFGAAAWAQEPNPGAAKSAEKPAEKPAAKKEAGPEETSVALPKPESVAECNQAIEKFKNKDIEGCFKLLEQAEAKHPELPPAKVMLGALLANRGEMRAARAFLEKAAVERADHPEVYRHFAELALAEGRFTEASVLYDRAIEKASANDRWAPSLRRAWQTAAVTGLATVEENRGAWDAAWRHLHFVFQQDRKNVMIRWRLARAMFFAQPDKEQDALLQFRECHEADPRLEPAELAMGALWAQKGDSEKSEKYVREAVAKFPKDVRTHAGLAAMLVKQGRAADAAKALGPARELQPDAIDLRVLAALVARHFKEFGKAEEALQPALVKSPGNYGVSNQLALTLVEQEDAGKRRQGLELARLNAKAYPNSAEAITTLGWACYRTGNADEADKHLTSVVNIGQASSDCAYFLALIAAERKDAERVKKLCETALAAPGTFVHRDSCKELLEKSGKTK